jgi:amino acid transporter
VRSTLLSRRTSARPVQSLNGRSAQPAIPEGGGYYVWVKRALGEYWGFQCGRWSWLTTFVDSALYIALVTDYLQSWLDLDPTAAWLLGVAVIVVLAYLNIRGLNVIAVSSVVMTIIILAPFVVLTILGFANWHGVPWQPFAYPGQSVLTSIGYALALGMWMCGATPPRWRRS